ncbi:hypothetical protein ACFL2K_00640 [Candidatus Margulisiibacteriota bacterium]
MNITKNANAKELFEKYLIKNTYIKRYKNGEKPNYNKVRKELGFVQRQKKKKKQGLGIKLSRKKKYSIQKSNKMEKLKNKVRVKKILDKANEGGLVLQFRNLSV